MSKTTITVCAACLTAACWHGKHQCWAIKPDVVEKTLEELQALGLEHPCNWVICPDCSTACGGECQRQQSARVASRLRYPSAS